MSRLSDDYTPSTGNGTSGSGLPATVDTTVGNHGMFGLSYDTQPFTDSTSLTPTSAYTLDTSTPVTTAVDNAYMAWDPDSSGFAIQVKQGGFYLVNVYFGSAATLTDSVALAVGQDSSVSLAFAPALPVIPVPSGTVAFYEGISQPNILYIPSNLRLLLTPAASGTDTPDVSYAGMMFLPLFELSPT